MYGLIQPRTPDLFLDGVEPEVELDEVCEDGVEVGVQLEEHDLAEVRVVDVGEDVKEEAVDLPDVRVERGRELLALHVKTKLSFDIFKIAQDVIVIVGRSAPPSHFPHLKHSYRAPKSAAFLLHPPMCKI